MDETLGMASLDLSGRSYLVFDASLIIQNWVILTQIGRRIFPSLGFQCSDESPPQDSPRKKQSPQVRKSFQGNRTCLA